jgi:hypothetical protein
MGDSVEQPIKVAAVSTPLGCVRWDEAEIVVWKICGENDGPRGDLDGHDVPVPEPAFAAE